MIRIKIYQNVKNECVGFQAHGHAGMSEAGQDIVCAAASVLMINTVNAIEKFTSDKAALVTNDPEGLMDYRVKGEPGKETALLLEVMILGLRDMAFDENYEEYIELDFEEV